MANTDWTKPTTSTNYIQVLEDLKDLAALGATLMRVDNAPTTGQDPDAGAIVGSIKWSVSNNKFQKNTSTTATPSWADLTTTYNINVATVGGRNAAYLTDITKLTGGVLPAVKFDDISHGNKLGGSSHALATPTSNGFMSSIEHNKLDSLNNMTDAQVATAYNSETNIITSSDLTSTVTRRITGAAIANFIEEKLKAAITAVTFKQLYTSGTSLIDVKRGQYQELSVSTNTAITFKEYPNNPYTMYLYITPGGNTVTVPTGVNHRWSGGAQPAPINSATGIDLLTVNYNGKGGFFYMLLADMR